MDSLSYKTISVNKATAQKEWVVVDATDQVLGRLGTKVTKLLRGKYKPSFTPHPGGQREFTPAKLMAKEPLSLYRKVIKGMLPKNRLGEAIINNMYVYAGSEHPHQAQNPKAIDLNSLK